MIVGGRTAAADHERVVPITTLQKLLTALPRNDRVVARVSQENITRGRTEHSVGTSAASERVDPVGHSGIAAGNGGRCCIGHEKIVARATVDVIGIQAANDPVVPSGSNQVICPRLPGAQGIIQGIICGRDPVITAATVDRKHFSEDMPHGVNASRGEREPNPAVGER